MASVTRLNFVPPPNGQRQVHSQIRRFVAASASDVTAPVVANVTPAPGTAVTPSTTINFDVTDIALGRVFIMAKFNDGATKEIVFDSEGFAPAYSESTQNDITGGRTFAIVRQGGWPSSPTLTVFAVDRSGNENL